jgi:hypothetical protein
MGETTQSPTLKLQSQSSTAVTARQNFFCRRTALQHRVSRILSGQPFLVDRPDEARITGILSIALIANMLTPRKTRLEILAPNCACCDIVNDNQVGVYHCIARCVRMALLCSACAS